MAVVFHRFALALTDLDAAAALGGDRVTQSARRSIRRSDATTKRSRPHDRPWRRELTSVHEPPRFLWRAAVNITVIERIEELGECLRSTLGLDVRGLDIELAPFP
jgi:hypothetical protein